MKVDGLRLNIENHKSNFGKSFFVPAASFLPAPVCVAGTGAKQTAVAAKKESKIEILPPSFKSPKTIHISHVRGPKSTDTRPRARVLFTLFVPN